MMGDHPYTYGEEQVAKVSLEKMFNAVGLSEVDIEILYLRYGHGWLIKDIAEHISIHRLGREPNKPVWDGTIRYRIRKALKAIRERFGDVL